MGDTGLLRRAIDDYLRGLHETDVELLDEVFHPAASLFDVDDETVRVDPYWAWRRDVDARPDPATAGLDRDEEVLEVLWLSDDAATVSLRVRIFDQVFVDHLQLRIVAKTWHLERIAGRGTAADGQTGTASVVVTSVA